MNQDEHKDLPAFIIVSPKDIAARAYEIYLDRGASEGFDHEDWLRAEQELTAMPAARRPLSDPAIVTDCAGRNSSRDHSST